MVVAWCKKSYLAEWVILGHGGAEQKNVLCSDWEEEYVQG